MSSEYIKQLEDAVELLKKKFEDYSVEVDSVKQVIWNDLTCILNKQDGHMAHCLSSINNNNSDGSIAIDLAIVNKDYTKNCDDVVTISDIWKNIYSKEASNSFDKFHEVVTCRDITIIREMFSEFLKASSKIGQETRRSAGNILILSPEVSRFIMSLDEFKFVEDPDDEHEGFRICKVGNIGRFEVFIDKKNKNNKAVVIYKGKNTSDGAGCVLNNKGIFHWFRPNGYTKYWNVIDIK